MENNKKQKKKTRKLLPGILFGSIGVASLIAGVTTFIVLQKNATKIIELTFKAKDGEEGITFNDELEEVACQTTNKVAWSNCNKPTATKKLTVGAGTELKFPFVKWQIKDGAGQYVDINPSQTFNESTTIYPVFSEEPTSFDSQYYVNINGNLGAIVNNTESIGDKIEIQFVDGSEKTIPKSEFDECVYIGSKVSSISPGFLKGCKIFNQVITIPENVLFIGNEFLSGCDNFNNGEQTLNLTNITGIGAEFLKNNITFNQKIQFGDKLATIGNDFLRGCNSFNQSINLKFVQTVGEYFMSEMNEFNNDIIFEESDTTLTSAGNYFLSSNPKFNHILDLSKTKLVNVPARMLFTSGAFNSNIILPTTVENIGNNFLTNTLSKDTNINFNDLTSLKTIDYNFLVGTSFNKTLDFSKTKLITIGAQFLANNRNFNGQIIFPDTLDEIGEDFLLNCDKFNNDGKPFDLSNTGLTAIPNYFLFVSYDEELSFYGGVFNVKLSLPSSVATIGAHFLSSQVKFNNTIDLSKLVALPTSIGTQMLYNVAPSNNIIFKVATGTSATWKPLLQVATGQATWPSTWTFEE